MTDLFYHQILKDDPNCPIANLSPTYAKHIAGSLSQIADRLYDEYLTQGYSLTPEDIGDVLLADVGIYAGWWRLTAQLGDDIPVGSVQRLTLSTPLTLSEWTILSPVVRSHIDLVQARRMEGAGSLGVTPFGASSSECMQNYQQALETMKREAFCHECWSV